ncbi:MAG: GTPase Era [Alphaproteobacteria bacterium]|nr:GTPase Era [Alphaproteobacteria bacterium]
MTDDPSTHCGFVALVGAPNAGKSTLLNTLVGAKVSIVTHKAQTTRSQIRGVVTTGSSQLIFIDTPGIFTASRRLDRAMVEAAWSAAAGADIVALVIDAVRGLNPDNEAAIKGLENLRGPKILIINKIDRKQPQDLLALTEALNKRMDFAHTFMVCAQSGEGVADFIKTCHDMAPPGPWHFPEDQLSDLTQALTAAEATREKLFMRVHDEIPYNTTVETERFQVQKDGSFRIDQVVYVARASHKKIILGKSGQTIKAIGMEARKDLSEMFGVPVHLFLFVKVRENWTDKPEHYEEMGLEFPAK